MCQQCVDAVKRYYPDVTEDECGWFLMAATCFPFGSVEDVTRQLREAVEKGAKTKAEAVALADKELEQQMREFHRKYPAGTGSTPVAG